MWICVKAKDRDITLVGKADTGTEIFDVMYDDMCNEYIAEHWLTEALDDGSAEIVDMNARADTEYGDEINWQCFLV